VQCQREHVPALLVRKESKTFFLDSLQFPIYAAWGGMQCQIMVHPTDSGRGPHTLRINPRPRVKGVVCHQEGVQQITTPHPFNATNRCGEIWN